MPDHPAEALADLADLAGSELRREHYQRWDADDRHTGLDLYRGRLDAHGPHADLVLPHDW